MTRVLLKVARFTLYAMIAIALTLTTWKKPTELVAFAEDRYQELQLFAKVLNLVQQYYVEEVDTKKLIYGGIKGMLRELDPHTNFLPPEIFSEFESETSGEFGGLGIEITVQEGVLTVISPIEDTPAWKAGIKPGDKIIAINGVSTKGMSLADAAQHMRGNMGSKIILGIYREGFERPQEFTVERGTVRVKSAKYTDLDNGYAYIRLTSFIESSFSELQKIFKAHEKKYGKEAGVILDLRKNPGGLLDQAVQISDLFIEEGDIVSTMGRNKKEKEVIRAKKPGTMPYFPMIVLIDEYSASASEILAGALQDNKRAVIMGQRSFGKGSVQSVVKLGDGSGLKLTVARYYTPKGRSIQALGIEPDVVLEDLDSQIIQKAIIKKENIKRERDIEGHLLGEDEAKSKQSSNQTPGPNAKAKAKGKGKGKGVEEPSKPTDFWWTADAAKEPANLSPKDKLLHDDFEVLQAYNYLKAWQIMKDK
jgi:carboxyl-terminal processing protease